jgi:hypothetical protein
MWWVTPHPWEISLGLRPLPALSMERSIQMSQINCKGRDFHTSFTQRLLWGSNSSLPLCTSTGFIVHIMWVLSQVSQHNQEIAQSVPDPLLLLWVWSGHAGLQYSLLSICGGVKYKVIWGEIASEALQLTCTYMWCVRCAMYWLLIF